MFTPLPAKLEKLELALNQLDTLRVKMPPPFVELGKRLRLIYDRERIQSYDLLTQSEWRQLPYSLWVSGMTDLEDTHADLISRYWSKELPEALKSSPRRAKRWLMPLFFVYCDAFDQNNPSFLTFSSYIRQVLVHVNSPEAKKLNEMDRQRELFSPASVATNLAGLFFTLHHESIESLLKEHLLWSGFESTKLGLAVLLAGLQLPAQHLREFETVRRIIQWEQKMHVPAVKTSLRIPFADRLLLVWANNRKIPEAFKNLLLEFFLNNYGDPRLVRRANYQWKEVNSTSIGVMQYLLTGDTLKNFMRILERTADDIWRYRQKFWIAYYDAGYIEEAWLVLGSHARTVAENTKISSIPLQYGKLESGVQPTQSVLLLRIGDLIFSEWSHNGSLRAYMENDQKAPVLYQSIYYGEELREPLSLDFHDGMNKRPQLTHAHSDSGTWQRKARNLINRYTSTYLNDSEILL